MSGRDVDVDALFERDADTQLLDRRRREELGLVAQVAPSSSTPVRFGPESILGDEAPQPPRAAMLRVALDARPERELIPGAVVTVVASVHDDGDVRADDVLLRIAVPNECEPVAGSFARGDVALDGDALLGEGVRVGTIAGGESVRVRFQMRILPGTRSLDVIAHASAPGVPTIAPPALRLTRRAGHTAFDAPRPFFELEAGETDALTIARAVAATEPPRTVDAIVDEPAAPVVAAPAAAAAPETAIVPDVIAAPEFVEPEIIAAPEAVFTPEAVVAVPEAVVAVPEVVIAPEVVVAPDVAVVPDVVVRRYDPAIVVVKPAAPKPPVAEPAVVKPPVPEPVIAQPVVAEPVVARPPVLEPLVVKAAQPEPLPAPKPPRRKRATLPPSASSEPPRPYVLARTLDDDEVRTLERIFGADVPHGLAALALLSSIAAVETPLGDALGVRGFTHTICAAVPRAVVASRMDRPLPIVVTRESLEPIRASAPVPDESFPHYFPLLVTRLDERELGTLRTVLERDLDDVFLRGVQVLLAVAPRALDGVPFDAAARVADALAAYRVAAGAWLMRVTVRRAVDRRYDPLTAADAPLHEAGRKLVSALRDALA